jgi:hypothetical protein
LFRPDIFVIDVAVTVGRAAQAPCGNGPDVGTAAAGRRLELKKGSAEGS